MQTKSIYAKLPELLLPWYDFDHRQLPWREDKDPYHIWVSEIMLQQTRVEAVKGYYSRFLEKLPTIRALAEADDELLHKLWEGLGYYSRVRNLKKAACQIVSEYGGVFPEAYATVRKLAGIGPYTAGAICSIAFNMPTPAVDGNVLRVISRLTNDETPIDLPAYKENVQKKLGEIYPERAGDFTQALMELGATLCGPNRKPECERCPCREICVSHSLGTAENLPIKSPKRQRREEDRTVFILNCEDLYCLEKRPSRGLLAGLWQFPNVSGKLDTEAAIAEVERMGLKVNELKAIVERKHIFTHIQWNMRGVYARVKDTDSDHQWFSAAQIQAEAALPTAFRQFWEEIEHIGFFGAL